MILGNRHRVIFYPGPMHLFWTTGIYYLDILAQHFHTTAILENATNREIEIVKETVGRKLDDLVVFQGGSKLAKHRQYKRISREIVDNVRPDLVVVDHDMYPFELYLLRRARRFGSVNICYQAGLIEGLVRDQYKRTLAVIRSRFERKYQLSGGLSRVLAHTYSIARELWYYYLAPLLVGELPFIGKSSAFVQRGRNGMRDSDFSIVFTEREKKICIVDGVPESKIIIIPHPLSWSETKRTAQVVLRAQQDSVHLPTGRPLATVFLDHSTDVYRVKRSTGEVIRQEEIYGMWEYVLSTLSAEFQDVTILVKKHPAQQENDPFVRFIESVVKARANMVLIKENVPAMALVSQSFMIISENSTVLYVSSLFFSNKPIISLDLDEKLFGDVYRDTPGIMYVSRKDQLENLRNMIADAKGQGARNGATDGGSMLINFLSNKISSRKTKQVAKRG